MSNNETAVLIDELLSVFVPLFVEKLVNVKLRTERKESGIARQKGHLIGHHSLFR